MSATMTLPPLNAPQKNGTGWIIEIPSDMAQIMGVAEGSIGMLYPKPGGLEIEILPPITPELKEEARETYEELKEYFAEMKRIGD